ncbi:hypothetical protein chiPu_0012787 [Chiloscyllium punctatum]|uniref:Uncharacterized protein n=1 Tax=Chiloscyllium punctatum TaxID=137246 RepID=A0A401SV66_CHIPU|nr:hypothetical protein [Chiloscyllium punctatum]
MWTGGSGEDRQANEGAQARGRKAGPEPTDEKKGEAGGAAVTWPAHKTSSRCGVGHCATSSRRAGRVPDVMAPSGEPSA